MKKLLLLLLMSSAVFADGPKRSFTDPRMNDELDNVYHDIKFPKIIYGTARRMDIASGTVTSGMILGTTTNDLGGAGRLGEYIAATDAAGVNAPATNVWGDLLSISLTPGDWDVTALVYWNRAGATWSRLFIGISPNAGNTGTGLVPGINEADVSAGAITDEYSPTIPVYRVSIAATATYYLKFRATYSAGTPGALGSRISARRVR